jgi:hypothetical protein
VVGVVNAVTSLLLSIVMIVVALSIVPPLFRILVPSVGDLIWRGYWGLMRWAFTLPLRLLAVRMRAGRGRQRDSDGPRGGAR